MGMGMGMGENVSAWLQNVSFYVLPGSGNEKLTSRQLKGQPKEGKNKLKPKQEQKPKPREKQLQRHARTAQKIYIFV